MHNELAH